MKTIGIALLLLGAGALATGTSNVDEERNTLTTIDQVPTKPQLDQVFGADALSRLATLATSPDSSTDPQNGVDPGIKLRAIHALAKYCGNPPDMPCTATELAHQSVEQVVAATRSAQTGTQVLILRAAIETLGSMRVSTDVSQLTPLLDHPSRDIRAATARALRDLCNPQAITLLRARYNNEMTDQVKLAISEALRILGECAANP